MIPLYILLSSFFLIFAWQVATVRCSHVAHFVNLLHYSDKAYFGLLIVITACNSAGWALDPAYTYQEAVMVQVGLIVGLTFLWSFTVLIINILLHYALFRCYKQATRIQELATYSRLRSLMATHYRFIQQFLCALRGKCLPDILDALSPEESGPSI